MGYKLRGCAADHVEAGADQKRQHHRFAAKGDAPATAGNAAAERRGLGRDDNVVAVGGYDTGCAILEVAKDALGKTHVVVVSADPERVTAGGISGNNRCDDKVNSPIWNKAITTKTQPGHIEQRVPAAYTGTS